MLMKLCKACEKLQDQPAKVEPHGALTYESLRLWSEGDLERLRCGECGAIWQRFRTNESYSGKPQRWKVLANVGTDPTYVQRR
jgi:hypothetical protein